MVHSSNSTLLAHAFPFSDIFAMSVCQLKSCVSCRRHLKAAYSALQRSVAPAGFVLSPIKDLQTATTVLRILGFLGQGSCDTRAS